jgi:WD40 repeat protein
VERYRVANTGVKGPVAFTPDGRYIVGLQFDVPVAVVWAVTAQKLVERDRVTLTAATRATALSPDGKSLVVGFKDGLQFYALKDGRFATGRAIPGGVDTEAGPVVAFSPDGRSLAAARGLAIQLLDPADGKVTRSIPFPAAVRFLTFHPDGRHLIVVGYNRVVYILRLAAPPVVAPPPREVTKS